MAIQVMPCLPFVTSLIADQM